jgi:hypothetical protein
VLKLAISYTLQLIYSPVTLSGGGGVKNTCGEPRLYNPVNKPDKLTG